MSNSPSPLNANLRHRGLARAATVAEGQSQPPQPQVPPQRRNSTFSDSVSEAIRSSTDELFFPRAAGKHDDEESHWHSAPLGLALLPAIAGIFFQNGSAFVTDVTLLALAAVFLNWSVRLPWEWYRSARSIRRQNSLYDIAPPLGLDTPISPTQDEQEDETSPGQDEDRDHDHDHDDRREHISADSTAAAAVEELQIHELAALTSCFLFPIIGTWILHTIRSNLSRPSEGLVSNYNLTIFLLAAEVRPFSHLLKMVQSRTLHLQRIIATSDDDDSEQKDKIDAFKVMDLSKRIEELEAHVAEAAALRISTVNAEKEKERERENENRGLTPQEQEYTLSLVSQAAAEYRKGFQTDIDALNRAMRRYEKRTALAAYQTESRLHMLESKARDALSLAAAAQRSTSHRSRVPGLGLFDMALDWTSKAFLLPLTIGVSVVRLPLLIARRGVRVCRDMVFGSRSGSGSSRSSIKKRSPTPATSGAVSGSGSSKAKAKAPQTRKHAPTSAPTSVPSSSTQQKRTKRATSVEE
ncbi:uncharacterized protein DSM5745_06975 [Aspergillus mulundensis]|uniref:Uncharacterized protein n=1 Tax=Aspergillus mulundensis TaxID=1810919 RepID=A0A3D8RJT6_9EURO|nr:Uncharacterized protein DSM5745_06975 [Aspergillus mulundensis]RDW74313.1 Uncharacterized protein DSM5745_06975 [Aspergillus mulundensis]